MTDCLRVLLAAPLGGACAQGGAPTHKRKREAADDGEDEDDEDEDE